MDEQIARPTETPRPDIQPLRAFIRRSGVSRTTVWRWRRFGWLRTVMLAGQPYVLRADLDEFLARAARGEFAEIPKKPTKQKGQ